MLFTLFLTCAMCLAVATAVLLVAGRWARVAFRPLGVLLAAGVALAGGELAAWIWRLPPGRSWRARAWRSP